MKITYEEFIEKLKPEIKNDLKNHNEREYLKMILDDFYNNKFEVCQNKDSNDFRLDIWAHRFFCCFDFIKDFESKKYMSSLKNYFSLKECSGSFGYAVIKMCEDLFYE